ncbi:MAG: class II aldolase/adducin family protein, partial [Gammaproteobacteria bacterium]
MVARERLLREELACAFRWAARLDMHEGVANHFSVAVDDGGDAEGGGESAEGGENARGDNHQSGGRRFLMNPAGRHFSQMRASDLLLLNADGEAPKGENAPDPTAWCLHGFLHRHLPGAKCILHTHSPYATALASLADGKLLPIDQNACRFYGRVAYDENFGGMLLAGQEAARLAEVVGDRNVLVMRGHGVMVAAENIAEAFDLLYYFERSCKNQWLA